MIILYLYLDAHFQLPKKNIVKLVSNSSVVNPPAKPDINGVLAVKEKILLKNIVG